MPAAPTLMFPMVTQDLLSMGYVEDVATVSSGNILQAFRKHDL